LNWTLKYPNNSHMKFIGRLSVFCGT